ncbi:hypothetical protein [Hydrogenobaculum acidophilum]
MRTGFRILILDKYKNKIDEHLIQDKNLARAIKYIHKSQYIEASKWLFLASDSREKYILLSLINFALKQHEQALSYLETSSALLYNFKDVFDIYIQKPGEPLEYGEEFIKGPSLSS